MEPAYKTGVRAGTSSSTGPGLTPRGPLLGGPTAGLRTPTVTYGTGTAPTLSPGPGASTFGTGTPGVTYGTGRGLIYAPGTGTTLGAGPGVSASGYSLPLTPDTNLRSGLPSGSGGMPAPLPVEAPATSATAAAKAPAAKAPAAAAPAAAAAAAEAPKFTLTGATTGTDITTAIKNTYRADGLKGLVAGGWKGVGGLKGIGKGLGKGYAVTKVGNAARDSLVPENGPNAGWMESVNEAVGADADDSYVKGATRSLADVGTAAAAGYAAGKVPGAILSLGTHVVGQGVDMYKGYREVKQSEKETERMAAFSAGLPLRLAERRAALTPQERAAEDADTAKNKAEVEADKQKRKENPAAAATAAAAERNRQIEEVAKRRAEATK